MSDDDRGFFSPLDMHAADRDVSDDMIDSEWRLGALEVGIGFALGLGATAFLAWCYFSAVS